MSRFRRRGLADVAPYVPGEQPGDGGWVKLNTNEAPLPPTPHVAAAVAAAVGELRRYPDPFAEPLRSALAAYHGVGPEQVFVANGADEVIDCCFRAFCDPGDTVVYPVPTYSLLPSVAATFSVRSAEVPLEDDLGLPAALGTAPGALRFVVNPNAPTGVWARPEALAELLGDAPGVVAIDEAYADFAPASCVPLLDHHPSWLVVRTFSKGYALAGLRVGYAVAGGDLIADLYAVKDSYPVDRLAIAAALAALGDEGHHRAIVALVCRERERLTARLRRAGWDVPDSAANFVFARPPDGDAAAVAARLRRERILVRHFAAPRCADRLRITVGAPEENDRLLAALGA